MTGSVQQSGAQSFAGAELVARNTDDFGTTGSSAKARAGATVTMSFALSSQGPADLLDMSGGEGTPGLTVTPPPGTTVVRSSANCGPTQSDPKTVAHGPYYCWPGSSFVWSGSTFRFTLTLHVDKVIPGAAGQLRVRYTPDPVKNPYSAWYDPDSRNNIAWLRLN